MGKDKTEKSGLTKWERSWRRWYQFVLREVEDNVADDEKWRESSIASAAATRMIAHAFSEAHHSGSPGMVTALQLRGMVISAAKIENVAVGFEVVIRENGAGSINDDQGETIHTFDDLDEFVDLLECGKPADEPI